MSALFTVLAVVAVLLAVIALAGAVLIRGLRRFVRAVWPHS
jgi:hypothetical protein